MLYKSCCNSWRVTVKSINVSTPNHPTEQSEELLELANGCLCCSIKNSGAAAIERLMQKKGAFDHILLETTGLADPGSILPHPLCGVCNYHLRTYRRHVLAKWGVLCGSWERYLSERCSLCCRCTFWQTGTFIASFLLYLSIDFSKSKRTVI